MKNRRLFPEPLELSRCYALSKYFALTLFLLAYRFTAVELAVVSKNIEPFVLSQKSTGSLLLLEKCREVLGLASSCREYT